MHRRGDPAVGCLVRQHGLGEGVAANAGSPQPLFGPFAVQVAHSYIAAIAPRATSKTNMKSVATSSPPRSPSTRLSFLRHVLLGGGHRARPTPVPMSGTG
jgi:hypothetical protein